MRSLACLKTISLILFYLFFLFLLLFVLSFGARISNLLARAAKILTNTMCIPTYIMSTARPIVHNNLYTHEVVLSRWFYIRYKDNEIASYYRWNMFLISTVSTSFRSRPKESERPSAMNVNASSVVGKRICYRDRTYSN